MKDWSFGRASVYRGIGLETAGAQWKKTDPDGLLQGTLSPWGTF